tara:strand:- start:400 stop:651 length:252 start_codon:yes stop_codon:yes gene_type:complete
MTALEKLEYAFPDAEMTIADGFDDCVLGICPITNRVIYSYTKCLEVLMTRDGMTDFEAIEFMEYNVVDSYVGEKTPIWCYDNY